MISAIVCDVVNVADTGVPYVALVARATLASLYGEGTKKKSPELVAWPYGVCTLICPEPERSGVLVDSVVGVAPWTVNGVAATCNVSLIKSGMKFVPVIVIGTPCVPIEGVNELIVGGPGGSVMVKDELLETGEPPDTIMLMRPVVAPVGTVTFRRVFEAEITVAAIPLNCTEF